MLQNVKAVRSTEDRSRKGKGLREMPDKAVRKNIIQTIYQHITEELLYLLILSGLTYLDLDDIFKTEIKRNLLPQ